MNPSFIRTFALIFGLVLAPVVRAETTNVSVTIDLVDSKRPTISVTYGANSRKLELANDVVVEIDGKESDYRTLLPGDRAVVTYDKGRSAVTKIVVQRSAVAPAEMLAEGWDEIDIYFVHGWPGKQSHFTTFFERGVISKSLSYGGWLETAKLPGFDNTTHFPITYPPDELIDELGQPTTLPDPHGLSGSVLWKTNRKGNGDGWTPEMARVAGLVQGFKHDWRCLVVTRIEYVKGLLLHTLRSDFAYSRWLKRGKPLWQDLEDWFAAETAIIDLSGSDQDGKQGDQN